MSDKFELQKEYEIDPDKLEHARGFDTKLQELGRELLSSMYMLVRNVKLYDPDNAIFEKPLASLRDCINTVIARDGNLNLQMTGSSFFLNEMLLRIDSKSVQSIGHLQEEFKRCNIGGFGLDKSLTVPELRNFIFIFSEQNTEKAGEQGVPARKLQALMLRNYDKVQEILEQDAESLMEQKKLDRKRYGLVVYARAVHFMRKYISGRQGHGPQIAMSKIRNFVQDLVDVSHGHTSHFIGLTTMSMDEDRLAHHSVNVAMLCIVLGIELGLNKEQLRHLGTAAIFHDVGVLDLPEDLLYKREGLTPEETATLNRTHLFTVARFLQSSALDTANRQNVIASYDRQTLYGKPIKDLKGETILVEQVADLAVFPRIIAIVDFYDSLTTTSGYSPEIALSLMNGDFKHHFDPLYLRAFARTLRGLVTRTLSDKQVSVF